MLSARNIGYELSDRVRGLSCGGIGAMHRLARHVGLVDDLNEHVDLLKVEALLRCPVKSMSSELLDVADLGWHGLDGDRRLAFRRTDDRGGFPWLTASRLPELLLFAPLRRGPVVDGNLPTHVRTPEGAELAVFGQELATDVGRRCGSPVEMMHLNRGIFDEASVSMIASAAVGQPIFFEPPTEHQALR